MAPKAVSSTGVDMAKQAASLAYEQAVQQLKETASLCLQEPLLVVAWFFAFVGVAWSSANVVKSYPWLPFLVVAFAFISLRVVLLVERRGLMGLIPGRPTLHRTAFELLGSVIHSVVRISTNLMRVGMLACMDLDDEERKEILMGMDPSFRYYVFQLPLAQVLPWPLRRLFFGRDAFQPAVQCNGHGSQPSVPTTTMPTEQEAARARKRRGDADRGNAGEHDVPAAEGAEEAGETEHAATANDDEDIPAGASRPKLYRKGTAGSILNIVEGMDIVVRTSKETTNIKDLNRIITEKMMGTTALGAQHIMGTAGAQVYQHTKAKVSEIGEGVQELVHDPHAKMAAATAVGGAVALGSGGGATGLGIGGLVGAACGIVPAVFTFGLSIPVCAALGSGIGLVSGATVAGTAGLVGGGTLGYRASQAQDGEGDHKALAD